MSVVDMLTVEAPVLEGVVRSRSAVLRARLDAVRPAPARPCSTPTSECDVHGPRGRETPGTVAGLTTRFERSRRLPHHARERYPVPSSMLTNGAVRRDRPHPVGIEDS